MATRNDHRELILSLARKESPRSSLSSVDLVVLATSGAKVTALVMKDSRMISGLCILALLADKNSLQSTLGTRRST